MKAYMIKTNKQIEPFNDHPGDCLILNTRLREIQKSVLSDLSIDVVVCENSEKIEAENEHLIFTDSLYFNRTLLETFIQESRRIRKRTVCALKPGITTLRTVVATQEVKQKPDRIEYGLYYAPGDSPPAEPTPIILNPDRFYETLPMPEHMFGLPEYTVPLPDKIVVQIDHWVNLWSANMVSLLSDICSLKAAPKLKLLCLAARAVSINQWKLLKKTNQIGHNCDIHPSAYIEGSTIGDNVRIGAGTVIRESKIGSGCNIENRVVISFSVLGERCYLGDGAIIRYSIMYPGAFTINSLLSCSVMGRNSFKGDGVTLTDFRFDNQPIIVLKNGKPLDTNNTFIGSCLGHDVYLGAGTTVAPGRAIPNGIRLTPDSSRVIQRIDPSGTHMGFRTVTTATP